MKMFDGKFKESMKLVPSPYTAERIMEVIETVLGLMDVIDEDSVGLYMLCGIATALSDFRFIKTSQKIVSEVRLYDYVGVGDSSLLRYLVPLVARGMTTPSTKH
jgi:hypothetical protein